MEFLLKELVVEILVLVPDRYIKSFTSTCYLFYPMLDLILKSKRRRNPFPRLDGCKIHHVPEEVIKLENKDYLNNLQEAMKTAMTLNLDLVKGDIIEFYPKDWLYDYTAIYNGHDIEETGYLTGGDAYLKGYEVLTEDVPLNYWKKFDINVNFPYHQFKDECLTNIKWDGQWYTTFIYEHCTYKLIYDSHVIITKEKFKQILNSSDICFNHEDNYDNYTLGVDGEF